MSRNLIKLIGFVVVLAVGVLVSQSVSGKPVERLKYPLILEYGDTIRSRGEAREIIGNVRLRHHKRIITADRALYDQGAYLLVLNGSVEIVEAEQSLKAEKVSYNEEFGDYTADGDVEIIIGDSVRILADRAIYTEDDSLLNLFNNVIIDNYRDESRITGRRARWVEGRNEGIIEGDPVYSLPPEDSTSTDSLVIRSKKLKLDRTASTAQFTGEVRLFRKDIIATADTLFHQPDSNVTLLTGSPHILREGDELSGDNVRLEYEKSEWKQIIVTGSAEGRSESKPGDPHRNVLSGQKIEIIAINDSTSQVRITGSAKGVYHLWDEKDNYQGVNQSAADSILIVMVNKKTERVVLTGRTNGTVYPPNITPPEEPAKAGDKKKKKL